MRTRSRTSGLLVVVGVILGMLSGMVPALASHAANDFASVSVTEAIAGQVNRTFPITVRHAAGTSANILGMGGTAPVNTIVITTPPGFRALGAQVPAGSTWQARIMPASDGFPRRIAFEGGTLAQNASATFNMISDVPVVGQDTNGVWKVATSADGGSNFDDAQASPSLTTRVRVLVAEAVSLTAPGGVTDNIVTQDQTATAVCSIRNFGNATRNVTASLSGANVQSAPAAGSIAPGGTRSFQFGIQFGNPGTTNLTCAGDDAAANSSTGPNVASQAVTVQAKRVPTYVAGSLSPRAINPNIQGPIEFALRVNFAGQPAATLNPTQTNFSFCGVTANLVSTNQLPANTQNGFELRFRTASPLPTLPNGNCATTLNIVGEDENNALIDFRPVGGTEAIKVDSLLPFVAPTLRAPTTQVPGTNDAAKNGDTVTFGGNVQDRDPASGELVACGTPSCTIVTDAYTAGSAHSQPVLFQYDGLNGGNEIASPIPVSVSLNSLGNLSGSFNGNYSLNPLTQSVILRVSVQDEAGNRHTNFSGRIEIDNILPKIAEAAAIRTSENADGTTVQRTIRVTFTECIAGATAALDWSMDGNVITAASMPNCQDGRSTIDLTTAQDLADDGPHGTLSYAPNELLPNASRPNDRVGHPLEDQDSNIVDKITPLPPVITQVGGRSPNADGTFTINSPVTTVTVTNAAGHVDADGNGRAVRQGYTIQVAKADGTVLGSGVAQGNSITIPVDLGPVTGGTIDLDIRAISFDTAPVKNFRAGNLVRVLLDLLAPRIVEVQALANSVQVTFSETIVAGRNNGLDWEVRLSDGEIPTVSSITGTGNIRILNMGSGYDASSVSSLAYLYFGNGGSCGTGSTAADDADCRYEDTARNQVLDQVVTSILKA